MTALADRNRKARQVLRRAALDANDLVAIAVLNPRPRRDPDPETVIVGYRSEYRDWAPGELAEAFGK